MNYEKLVKERAIEEVSTSKEELADHLRKASQDINTAQKVEHIDLDWSFNIAYNGILQTAITYMRYKGYRPRGDAKHYNTFRFLEASFPKTYTSKIKVLQSFRKKRNRAVYHETGVVTESEAKIIISFSIEFLDEITKLLPQEIVEFSKKE